MNHPIHDAELIEKANALIRDAYDLLPFDDPHPVGRVQWVHADRVVANDYNPNAVAFQEMKLLHTSISEDGYTQPVVAIWDPSATGPSWPEPGRFVIVDGFHRFTVLKSYSDIATSTHGYLPVVILDKPIADRIASTVRHNRARGKHSIAGMGSLVFQLLTEGVTDQEICQRLGMEPEELARLKHITGYSKLYANQEFGVPVLTTAQLKAKARYAKENPDERVPNDF